MKFETSKLQDIKILGNGEHYEYVPPSVYKLGPILSITSVLILLSMIVAYYGVNIYMDQKVDEKISELNKYESKLDEINERYKEYETAKRHKEWMQQWQKEKYPMSYVVAKCIKFTQIESNGKSDAERPRISRMKLTNEDSKLNIRITFTNITNKEKKSIRKKLSGMKFPDSSVMFMGVEPFTNKDGYPTLELRYKQK